MTRTGKKRVSPKREAYDLSGMGIICRADMVDKD
jgi:hypothetical protein